MRKSKAIIGKLALSIFLLLASPSFAQIPVQDTGDHGAMDTLYIECTAPDPFYSDSIRVSFDLIFWTDANVPNEYIGGWSLVFRMSSSNPQALARVIIDPRDNGPVFKGTSMSDPNTWECLFNSAVPASGLMPAAVVYGAIMDCLPPASEGPPLTSGRHILAHIVIVVKDTTTIYIDTTSCESCTLRFVRIIDGVEYWPLWKQPTNCSVTPLTCIYKPGDANGNGKVDLGDLIYIVNHIMKGGPAPFFECQADLNADLIVTLIDVVFAVNYLFKGGPLPVKSWACCL